MPSKIPTRGRLRLLPLEFFLTEKQRYRKQPTGSNLQANPAGAGERYLSRGVTETSAYLSANRGVFGETSGQSRGESRSLSRKRRRGLRENAGKTGKAAWGVLSLRIVVRVFLVVRVVCGG